MNISIVCVRQILIQPNFTVTQLDTSSNTLFCPKEDNVSATTTTNSPAHTHMHTQMHSEQSLPVSQGWQSKWGGNVWSLKHPQGDIMWKRHHFTEERSHTGLRQEGETQMRYKQTVKEDYWTFEADWHRKYHNSTIINSFWQGQKKFTAFAPRSSDWP